MKSRARDLVEFQVRPTIPCSINELGFELLAFRCFVPLACLADPVISER